MAEDRIQMPSSMGGITRYFDDVTTKVQFKPGHIILLAIVIMAVMIILYNFGDSWLGI